MKQVRFSLNVGTLEQHRFAIPDGPSGGPPQEGDVLELEDDQADRLCRLVACCTEVQAQLPQVAATVEETPRAAMLRRKKDGELKSAEI